MTPTLYFFYWLATVAGVGILGVTLLLLYLLLMYLRGVIAGAGEKV